MGRYQFTSPGGLAGEGIVEVLAQRRAEARQKMLDELTQRNVESEISNRAAQLGISKANADSEIAARNQQISESKQQGDIARIGIFKNAHDINEDVSGDPNFELAKSYGLVGRRANEPEFQGPVQEGESLPVPKTSYYLGDDKERQRSRVSRNMSQVLSEIQANPKLTATEKAIMIAKASEDPNLDAGFWESIMRGGEPDRVYDEQSGLWSEGPGKGGHIIARPRPPQVQHDTGQYVGPATDASGKVIPGKAVVMHNGELKIDDIPVAGVGPKPTEAGTKKDRPSPAEFVNLAKLRGLAEKERAANDSWFRIGPAKQDAQAAYEQNRSNILARSSIPQDIFDEVLRGVGEFADVPTQKLIDMYTENGSDEASIREFANWLMIARGQVQ